MDLLPLEQAAITAAATIVSACAFAIASYIRSHVRNVELASALVRAETVGAGIAHDALTTAVANGVPDWAAAKETAIQEGTAAARNVLASVTVTGVTAALAPLLAVDPSVPAGQGSTVTVTAGPGQEAAAVVGPLPPEPAPVTPRRGSSSNR